MMGKKIPLEPLRRGYMEQKKDLIGIEKRFVKFIIRILYIK